MTGYQFVHFEAYAKVSKKGSGGTGHATEGRTADEVIAEAAREFGNYPHVKNPKAPAIVDACRDGYTFKDLKADYEKACNAQVSMANGKTRKNRSTALTLATMVCSYPIPCDEIKTKEDKDLYFSWERRSLDYAKEMFGDDYCMAVRHTDEKFPHLHIFAVAPDARRLHPGLEAAKSAENCGKKGRDLGKAASEGLRAAQDRYYEMVGKFEGQARLGPKRMRLSREDWQRTKAANEKYAEMLNNPINYQQDIDRLSLELKKMQNKKQVLKNEIDKQNAIIKRTRTGPLSRFATAKKRDVEERAREITKRFGESIDKKNATINQQSKEITALKTQLETAKQDSKVLNLLRKHAPDHVAVAEELAKKPAENSHSSPAMQAGHGADQQIMAGDDEATRALKQATNAQNAANRNSFDM